MQDYDKFKRGNIVLEIYFEQSVAFLQTSPNLQLYPRSIVLMLLIYPPSLPQQTSTDQLTHQQFIHQQKAAIIFFCINLIVSLSLGLKLTANLIYRIPSNNFLSPIFFRRLIPVFNNGGFVPIIYIKNIKMEFPLTQNGIIHISAGFDGPFILQVFSLRKQNTTPVQLNMCLTDGQIYIGATYLPPKFFDLDNFNIVKITGQYFDRMKPINIKTLEILNRAPKKLIGNPPCTLVDYFNKEILTMTAELQPRKKVKITQEELVPIVIPQSPTNTSPRVHVQLKNGPPKEQPKIQKQEKSKPQTADKSKIQTVEKSRPQPNEKRFQKKLRLASESQNEEQYNHDNTPDNFKATFIKDSAPTISIVSINAQDLIENSHIRDLFERHIGWVILCRVNYRSLARCENGMHAVNFVLQDQNGDQIKCVYFESSLEKAKQMLRVGKYYLFAGGQIKESKQCQLQIIFDKNSQFIEKQNVGFQVNPKKLTRVDKIIQEYPENQINVIGIIRKIKNKGQKLKTKNKYTATICDPITNYEIDFLLFLNEDEKPIQKGMIIVLHNYQIYRQNNICRLNSSYRSYYYQEKPTKPDDKGDLVNQFHKIIQESVWDNDNYKNISMFAFTQRPIHELKTISKKTDDQKIYSSVDCWIMEIAKKKAYYACKTCKKPTEKKQMGLFQCSVCKKMVQVILTFTLSVTFTDYTGSCMIDVIGEHAENLIEKKALQFYSLPPEQQNNQLENLRYKNVQLRLKTEKKSDGKLAHSVWGIERTNPETPLKQIKKYLTEKSVKFDDKW